MGSWECERVSPEVASRSCTVLEPGDVLYIPALWFHSTTSRGFSVGVNLFYHGHDAPPGAPELYDRKDLYGPPARAPLRTQRPRTLQRARP